jgi:hypothetical protein
MMRKEGASMRIERSWVRNERKSADAECVVPHDWSALGARIRQAAMVAATLHMAERAAARRATAMSEDVKD